MAQSNDNDDIKWLYGKLKAKGYNIGSEADFKSSLANGEDRKWYYEKAKGMGLNMGSMADFEGMYAPKTASVTNQQQQATTTQATAPVASQQQKDRPLTQAERQSMIWQAQQLQDKTNAMIADANERMKNMTEYGVGLNLGQTKKSGMSYNPRTKKFEQTYVTPTGNRYSSKALADAESLHYRQETSKPLGLNMDDKQIDATQKPANAAVAALWKEAEAKYAADSNKNAEEVYSGNPWLHAGREMHIVDAATNTHKNEVSRLTRFDLQNMMDNAWGRVGKQMTASCYQQLKQQYPTASEQQLQNSASAMARQLSDNAVYKYAVAKNTPKSTLEFFAKTAADMNLLRTISKGLARSEAGTTGDMGAYEAAMGEYGKNHRWAQIGGTVTGMLFDPTTYISGGVGSMTARGALNVGGRLLFKKASTSVGSRMLGSTLAGRVISGVGGGAGNLGTYEGIKEAESQWLHGGHINPQTGENDGYSAGDILKSTGRGMLLGSVTGTVSPLLGNVADKWVKATSNTAGKVGIRAGELATSTVAEGTIFSIPEWISGDGDAIDVWTDNMAMMLGFKAQHMVKSAPRVIAGLRPIENPQTMQERNHNRMSFVERLRKQVDASPRDMAFTNEEREELQRYGYGDLATLFTRSPRKQPKAKSKPTSTDGGVMYLDIPEVEVEDLGKQWLKQHPEFDGYDAMERLMQDPNVSQSARAKAYYILTGRQLPMGSVTGYTTEKDEDGNIFVKSVTANGEVVTSRRFADEASAKKEQDKIMRQAELNSVDVGERYTDAKADNKVFNAAVEAVAPGADPETVKRNYQAVKQGDKDAVANYGQMVDAIDKFMKENESMADAERPEAIRAAIKEDTGVDVDEAIKKEPSNRSEPEKVAVQDYVERLFPKQAESPMSDDETGASAIYDQSRLLWGKVEQGDANAKAEVDAIAIRMQEAYKECEDAFGTDAEMRMAEMQDNPWALANNPELTDDQRDAVLYYINAKAAMDGVQDASNDALENKRREVAANVERHTHKDYGIVQPATMKADDKPVYIVKGNVVPLPDGTGIDVRNSDQSIVICDAETGEYKFTSPDQIYNIGEAIDPQAELDEAYANIQAEYDAMLGGADNGESVQNEGENVQQPMTDEQQPMTDEQLQQYAQRAFDEATQGNEGFALPQKLVEQMQQHNQQMLDQEQQRKKEEANRKPTALSRVPINEETQEPMFEKADKETALDALNEVTGGNEANTTAIVNAQVEQATKALEALKKKKPTKKTPALKGSPMTMVKAQQEADANYNTAMEQYNGQVAEAEETLSAWSRIYALMNERKRAVREQQEAEQRERDKQLHDAAVAQVEEQKRIAAEKAAEQAEVGTHAVNPKLKEKWDKSTKVEGNPNALTLADGSTLRGHYVLTEAGAASASHDISNAFEPTEGFPIDENGESVNDRDYMRDKDAQQIVRGIARNYDSRALQSPVIVSKDGIVLSGNNRTMSGDMAAQQGTDNAYIDHLREFGQMYGFTPEQIDGMKHPRVVFVPDEELPYDASTFARFNAEQQKKQSKPEQAVKLGKVVPDNVFNIIVRNISRYDRLSDFYADDNAVASAIRQLHEVDVINEMQLPEMRTGNTLSAVGREFIENVLVGKVFQTSPDAVRQIISTPTLRHAVIMGLNEIAHNRTLAKSGYDLSQELGAAVDLVARAKAEAPDIYKEGMPVSPYGRQAGLFDDEYGDSRVTDATVLLLADVLNSGKPSDLRKMLATYNNEAQAPANGQIDMFSGDVRSKEQLLNDVNEYYRNATPREQQAIVDAAIAERKQRAEASSEAGNVTGRSGEHQAATPDGGRPANVGGASERQSDLDKAEEIKLSDEIDENGRQFVLTSEGELAFGEIGEDAGLTAAPILLSEGMITNPATNDGYGLVHIEARHGDQIRKAGYKSVVDFIESVAKNYDVIKEGNLRDGHQTYRLQLTDKHNNTLMVELSGDGTYWNVNTAGIFKTSYSKKNKEVYNRHTTAKQPVEAAETSQNAEHSDTQTSSSMNVPTSSNDKVINNQSDLQENGEKSSVNNGVTPVSEQIETASAEVNTEPTEAQKKAGNYKKGHVQVGTFDITIEQPQGSVRKGTDANGKQWESKMHNTYGYFRGTEGVDGDHIDVFLSNDIDGWNGRKVYVVDQYNPDGTFDEHKVMLGFNDMGEAKNDYLANYEKGWEDGRRIVVSATNLEDFEKWISSSHRKTKPFAEYAGVKKETVGRSSAKTETKQTESKGYSITPTTYTNKKGKTSDVFLLTFDHALTTNQERAVKEFAKERTGEERFAPARGWKDRESGGWIFRNEEDARKAAEMVDNEDAVADNQPLTAQEMRDAVEPKKPAARKKAPAKKPANKVEIDTIYANPEVRNHDWSQYTKGDVFDYEGSKSRYLFAEIEGNGHVAGVTVEHLDENGNAVGRESVPPLMFIKHYKKVDGGESRAEIAEPHPELKRSDRNFLMDEGKFAYMLASSEANPFAAFGGKSSFADEHFERFKEIYRDKVGDYIYKKHEPYLKDFFDYFEKVTDARLQKPAEPIREEKPQYEVSDEEMKGLMNDIRDILGIGDDEGDTGLMFRDPDELTAEQRQKLMSVGQRLAMSMVERGNESFGDYASMMVKAFGNKVRPWLKAFYGGLEYVPGYDKYALTPYEEVKAFDVENFDKPQHDVLAQANMIVEEGKAQVAANKANRELKEIRNEQRKETEKQTAADTEAVAAEAEAVANETDSLAETSSDEQALNEATERVDDALDKVNDQLALLGYYEADHIEKDFNEAYGYMRNAERKAVKDAAKLASQLIDDLGLDRYEATHGEADKKGERKTKPLAVANIAPSGGDITIHLPLAEGRELYMNIPLVPSAGKGVVGHEGDNLKADLTIMWRVEAPTAKGNDRYGQNRYAPRDVTYKALLERVQRDVYKYIPQRTDVVEGEYKVGDKVEYSPNGKDWYDAVVAQPNDMDGIRIDTGTAPVMWVNAQPNQLRHKVAPKADVDAAVKNFKDEMSAKLEQVKDHLDKKMLEEQIAQRDKFIDELDERVHNGEQIGTFAGAKNVDLQSTLLKCIGERDALEDVLDHLPTKPTTESIADNPQSWVGKTFTYNGMQLVCNDVDKGYATFDNKTTFMGQGFDVSTVQGWLKNGKMQVKGAKPIETNEDIFQKAERIAKEGRERSAAKAEIKPSVTPVRTKQTTPKGRTDEDLLKEVLNGNGRNWAKFYNEANNKADTKEARKWHGALSDAIRGVFRGDIEKANEWAKDVFFPYIESDAFREDKNSTDRDVVSTPVKLTPKTGASKKKKVKPEQQVGDLFAGLFDEQNDNGNGLQRNDDAVRTETVPTDNSGQQQGLRGGERAPRKATAQESGRPDGGRGGQSTGANRAESAGLHGLTELKNTRNNHSERGADHAPTSVNGRIEANVKAIELAHELLESGETATPEQMSVLRQFSGWGGLGGALDYRGSDWKIRERNKNIRELLGEEAYEQAVMSANSAYYTPAYVVDTLWDIAGQLGFKGGNILEGSAGIGNILGQMPTTMSSRSDIHAIEIDGTSGGILSLLYPDAKVDIQGFEQTRIPNGSVDLAITNVPFVTGLRVNDTTGDSDLSKKFHNIHDFCIAKNVRKLREGGLGIFISSNGTLDNSKALRDWVVNEGGSDFIGAFRMNNKTFGGTTVTSDIIVIRKRVNGQKSAQAIDVSTISGERTAEYQEPGERKVKMISMDYNKYFIEHPDHMAGEMHFAFEEGDTFRPTSKGLYPVIGKDQGKMLAEFVKTLSAEEVEGRASEAKGTAPNAYKELGKDVKEGSMVIDENGDICIARYGKAVPVASEPSKADRAKDNVSEEELRNRFQDKKIKGHTKAECFQDYTAIKSALADVMKYQTENEDNAGLQPLIDKLNKAFDNFVGKYGHFNKNNQLAWLRGDVDYPNVFSLETYKEQGDGKGGVVKTYGKADVMKGRVVEKENEPHPENVKDGVVVSMFKNGRIDVRYIAEQLGKSVADVKREIIDGGLGFEDPTTRQIEVSYQYLSGNVREKLRQAEANNENGEYTGNIKALHEVVPMDIPAHLIDFTLGSSWLSPKYYNEYVKDRTDIDVKFTAVDGSWFMDEPYYVSKEKNRAFGVVSEKLDKTIYGHELIKAAIQNKTITVSKTEKHWDGTTETIVDREATAACAAKVDEIRQDFKDWMRQKMQSDADLSARMAKEYNDRFNNYVPMSVPGDFVPEYFGGATHKFKMRPHQGKAIVRGTMQPLLLAHEVGTGKTFTLISTAMEMRRLGTARKPMIVVQNATVGQFAASAKELYPNAKILTLEDNDRNAEGRKNFYAKIKYNDWDMIVVPQSVFEFIPDSKDRQIQFVQDKIEEKMLVLEKMREADSSGKDPMTRRAEKELADLEAEKAALTGGDSTKRTANNEKKKAVAKQNAAVKAQEMLDRHTDDVEDFDDMGIDALLIDEAHEYKHLGFATAMQRGVKGVDPSYSKKSQGVYLKTQAVLEKNNGRNVIFATGTPISNTAAEIWTFMRYLMPKDTMKEYGIYYFDDFVRNFGNIQQMPEFNTSGKFKEVNRFAGYVNLPELVRIWSGVADTVLTKDQTELVKKIPEMEGGKAQDIYLPQTRALRSVMKYVRSELDRFDQMSGKEKKENSSIPLTMYGIAQGAAVDARLVQIDADDDTQSKTNEAVRQTLRSLKETDGYKGTVAIFADHFQNKRSGFNLYEDIKKKLVAQGVPAEEIVVMKSGMTIKKKLEIFDKVNHGEVRVILGSTATLGTGVNIQERLHTLIHLDAPNRPMDYTQRNGRILRQGNLHKQWDKPVRVLRFGVEDSLDVTAYQRLKTKGAIADSVMEGERLMQNSMNNRVLEEEEDVFGDTVAQLSGSEYALLKNNAEKNVRKYESRRKQWEADQTYIHNAKPKLQGQIKAAEQQAEEANAHLLAVQKAFPDGKLAEISVGKQKFGTVDEMTDFIKEHNKKILDAVKAMKENPGNSSQTNTLTISLGSYDFVVKTEISRETVNSGGSLFAEIHRKMTYSCPELGLTDVPVKQSLLRNAIEDIIENVITGNDFADRFDIATRAVAHGKSELEQLKQREGKPFEFGKELEEAKRQLEEYSEAMKMEMAEKEKKYAEMDASVEAATDVVIDDEDDAPEDNTKFRLLEDDDPKAMELEALKDDELVVVFRNVQAFEDDDLGSPMAFTDAVTGERRTLKGRRWNYSAPKEIKLTDEQQKQLDELNRNGYIMVDGKKVTELKLNDALKFVKPKKGEAKLQYFLKKNSEDGGLWADYNPYDHAIETPLNTQFASAYKRPNLVVVRCLIPKSELDEPYHADYAAKPTGAHLWNNGRTLYLSRWSKIDKVLTREEEAELIDEYWKANPQERKKTTHRDYNRFVPQVRRLLEEKGYRFELNDKMCKELKKKGYNFEPAGKELTPEESRRLDELVWEDRDVIPGKEGQVPFVTNEDIARINAKMSGKWVGVPKAEMEEAMTARVNELAERLNTPVRIVRTDEEVAALPSVRQRRMKGSFNPMTSEVTIVVPNNANLSDVENTFVHEVVGHDGLRVLFPEKEKLDNALDELYRVSNTDIQQTIDRMAHRMYDAEVDRLREKKRKEHEAKGEDSNASYYADMAEAHAEASKKREQFKRDATEEYGADLAGRIGEKGFEKMSAEELTFWGKLKAMLQKALQKLLAGLKIPGKRKWSDKDWAFVLHEAYKRKKNGGNATVFDAADTEVMRRKTGFGEMKFSDGAIRNERAEELSKVNERFNEQLGTLTEKNADSVVFSLGRPSVVLQSAGVKNKPMKLYGNKVMKKMRKHGFALEELRDLPRAVADPIAVFNNYGDDGNRSILTELRTQQGNFLVSVNIGKDADIDFNIVRSVFGKGDENVVGWINKGLATYINKGKALSFLSHQSAPIAATAANAGQSSESLSSASQYVQQEIDKLDTATKVVKDFINPKTSDENVADEGILFRDGDMGLDETITQMKIAASQANADNWQAKQEAMKAIGGNLNKLRQAMARQREYDLSTVKSITDLAKVLLDNGLLDDLSKYETKRILSAVNNAHGKQDTSSQVAKVMDIMVDNQLRMGANMLGRLLSTRGSRVDARGIEVQGQLDPDGQTIAQVVRKATSLPKADIEERIAEALNRMGSDDQAVADEAALEYSGLQIAHQFAEDITESKSEEKALRDSIKQAKEDLDAGMMDKEAYREYVDATNDAIRQNKIERAEAYRSIVEQVGGVLGSSVERAKQWREAEKQRVEAIHHNANSDMVGRPTDEHHKESKVQKIANNSAVRFLLAPLGTFDQMLRMFGKKSVNGEGYLWNRYMRGWLEATEKEYTGYQDALKTLDEKVSDVFGKNMQWGDLFTMERKMPKATVTFWDGGEKKAHELTQGNLLYIYMVNKMADGRMKLRRMGITEDDVENIKEFVDPRFIELADWMQEEFLVEKRNEYNEVHKRMFGASMAAIENYFPLKILANARIEDVDVADDTTDTALPATSTGSIIKRRRNNLALDVMGADAFHVILDHVQQMERWAAFAEFNRDLNTLLSYKHFRNQVMNMSSVYGGGKTLWTNFRNVCSMAAGAYRPPIAQLDKAAVNIAKGVTAAKVSFRVFTALKQFLSMPAYLSDSNPIYLAANIANPIGAWKWSLQNLPLFEKRWKSRMAGDPRLMKSEMDWKMWQNRVVEIASRIGMSTNAFVDALTVAIGTHAMYQTKKKKYLRYGYDEEIAEKRAKQDATILFNQTQQSSESAFLSTMQVDRSWLTVLFTVFRNSSMSYTRQLYDAIRNIKHRFEPGYEAMSKEYMAKQMRRDGIDPDKADSNAKSEYRRSLLRDIARIGVFGYILQFAWNLGAYLPYLIAGDDKDEKSKMWDDVLNHTMFGSIEGLTGGDVMSSAGQMTLNGEANWSYLVKDMPLASDLSTILQKMPKDKVAAMNDVVNLLVQSGVGVNPQSLTDAVVAIMDYCGDDAQTSRECALLIARILNCPQSQTDKIYFDELGATAAEASKMTPAEIAERYAEYKIHRNAPLTGWAYSEEARDSVKTAMQNRVFTQAKEKLSSRVQTEETKQLLSTYDDVAKQQSELSKLKKTDRAAYREGMKQLRQNNNMRQHMRMKRYKHDMTRLTEKYLHSKDAAERESLVNVMFSTRTKMLEDIGRMKQQ